jgi:hypothetical protein
VIEKFLQGEEDPEWQVKPTSTNGKYIITRRKVQLEPVEHSEEKPTEEEKPPEEEKKIEPEKPKKIEPPPEPKIPYPSQPLPISQPILGNEYAIEILNELRAMGENKRKREAKREQKKEIKRQVRKHIPSPVIPPSSDDDDDEDTFYVQPPQPEPIQLPQRRRVMLTRS